MPTQKSNASVSINSEIRLLHRRIITILFLSTIALLTYLLVSDYYTSVNQAKKLRLHNLEGIVNNLAQRIDGDMHQSLSLPLKTAEPALNSIQNKDYQEIHKLLRLTMQAHDLNSPIHTFVKTKAHVPSIAFVVTSTEAPPLKDGHPSIPEELLRQLGPESSTVSYEAESGHWLSAVSPIKNSKGAIVAYVQIDDKIDNSIAAARAKTIQNTILCLIGITMVSLLIFPYLRQVLQKEAEDKIRLQQSLAENQHLFTTLERNETKLKNYAAKLELSSKELADFAHIASHDLKSPIRNIYAFAQLIKRRQGSAMDESTAEYLDFIISSADRATNLINGLLSYSSADKYAGEQKQFNLGRSALQAQHNLHVFIQQKQAKIQINDLPDISANPMLFTQVLQNLIDNAIKYNQSDFPVIEIGSSYANAEEYCFYVKDNGIGIPPEYHQKVFKMFTRLHSVKDYEGSGIGLAFCNRVMTTYGGKMWLESNEEVGTTVFFTLPKAMVATTAIIQETTPA